MLEPVPIDESRYHEWWEAGSPSQLVAHMRGVCATADGIPYMTPECVSLFKAKGNREKDQRDLATCLPLLSPDQRSWLVRALAQVHPHHPWIGLLKT